MRAADMLPMFCGLPALQEPTDERLPTKVTLKWTPSGVKSWKFALPVAFRNRPVPPLKVYISTGRVGRREPACHGAEELIAVCRREDNFAGDGASGRVEQELFDPRVFSQVRRIPARVNG